MQKIDLNDIRETKTNHRMTARHQNEHKYSENVQKG